MNQLSYILGCQDVVLLVIIVGDVFDVIVVCYVECEVLVVWY